MKSLILEEENIIKERRIFFRLKKNYTPFKDISNCFGQGKET